MSQFQHQSGHAVTHVSRGTRLPLSEVFGGGEAVRMTPEIARNIDVLDEVLSCWFDSDTTETEVPLLSRSLDVLATAEIPGTGEEIAVAIENQYGVADPDHFGRLVGWYMPETSADMGVLIAEGFDPHLIRAVEEGRVVKPKYGLWLVEATGQVVNGEPVVSYELQATSLDRDIWLARKKAYRDNAGASVGSSSEKRAADKNLISALFSHIAATGHGELSKMVAKTQSSGGSYRHLLENENGCHVVLFVGRTRISIGSAYAKKSFDKELLDVLTSIVKDSELDPEPRKRELRSAWWRLADVGTGNDRATWPADLGSQLDAQYETVRLTINEHQERLMQAIREFKPRST